MSRATNVGDRERGARAVILDVPDPSLNCEVRSAGPRGLGLFAARDLREGVDGDHSDYAGRGRYVIDLSPGSYMNHSCEPNCRYRMRSILVKDVVVVRPVLAGEELTHDYAAGSVDQFAGRGSWTLDCRCGSARCRGTVTGDLFALPVDLQRRYWPDLPSSIRRRYRDRQPSMRPE